MFIKFHKTFVLIAEFHWLPEEQKGLFFIIFLNLLFGNHKGDEADACISIYDISLDINYVFVPVG